MFAAPVCSCLVWGSGGYINFDRPARGKLSPSHFLVSLDVFKIYTSLLMCVSLPLLQNISEFSKPPYYHRMCFSLPLCSKISQSSQNAFSVILCLSVLFRVCSSTSKKHQQVHSCLSASVQSLLKYIQKVRDSQGMSRCFCVKSLLQKLQKPRVRVHVCRLLSNQG